jgi:hypothetical protein
MSAHTASGTATNPAGGVVRRGAGARLALGLIRAYQIFSHAWGGHCRFTPSCSAYAHEAIARHGVARGLALAARRLARCHPLGGSGYDPVPRSESVTRRP